MLDNELFVLLRGIIKAEFALLWSENSYDIPLPSVVQNYQPAQGGAPNGPSVLIHKMPDHRYGFPSNTSRWDSETSRMIKTTEQVIETTFQLSTLLIQPADFSLGLSSNDLAEFVANILQSDSTAKTLLENDVQILRITDLGNRFFTDEKERQESAPYFDFTVIHKRTTIKTSEIIQGVDIAIYPI